MSSILRALKKLENEPRHLEKNQVLDNKFVPLADTSPQKNSAGIIMMAIGGGLVCGLVILAGWWVFSNESQAPPDVAPQQISQQGMQQPEAGPAAPQEPEPSESIAVSAQPATEIVVSPETADSLPDSAAVETPQHAPLKVEEIEITPDAEERAEMPVPIPAQTSAPAITEKPPPDKVTVAVTKPPEVSPKVKEIEIPILNDPEVKLQALTWSKDPQKRIAVINNRILRQGDVVYGYRINIINQDDVVLSDGGEKWKLPFRIK